MKDLLCDIQQQWYDLGLQLNVDDEELDAIKQRKNNDPGDCLIEMLIVWLSSTDEQTPTREALADALLSKPINKVYLAERGSYNNYFPNSKANNMYTFQ